MTGGKNKKIKKIKSGPDKKQNFHLRTSTSILYEEEIQETIPDTAAIRQYKQQLNFIKNFMSQVAETYDFISQKIQHQRDFFKAKLNFPTISIDRLFDHKETTILNSGFIFSDLTDYLKLVNNQLQMKRKKIILNLHSDSFILTEDTNRRQDSKEFKGWFITLLEREVFQNRQNFMEKIKQNQSKYQQCNSQLSQISKELLFLSKLYMENSSRIKKLGEQMALKMSTYFSSPQFQTKKLYFEVIMKKNIIYAVKDHQVDFLNYFRQKDYEERNSLDFVPEINDENQFLTYLRLKKPKKGKPAKYGLHTACSCCFSNYYEPYNPLIACENCNLRCHKLCYNLKQKPCGNCSYQRLLKSQKQITPHCIICRQKGEMTIKLRDKVYAHGFCLIVHNQWKIQNRKKLIQMGKEELQKGFETYYNQNSHFLLNPNQTFNSDDTNFQLLYLEPIAEISSKETLGEEPKILGDNLIRIQEDEQILVNFQKKCEQDSQCCKVCSQPFNQNLYLTCSQCYEKLHAYCAFFEGFDFKVLSNAVPNNESNNRINILFDCCSKKVSEKEKLKKSRQFVLNRNRFLFENL